MLSNIKLHPDNFEQIADVLLNHAILYIKADRYRLSEIEFYYKSSDHNDQYVHCNPDQLVYNKFYFHKFGNGTYKNGNYKGVDVTFGNKEENIFFGILIRSVMNLATGDFCEGPCKFVNLILEKFTNSSVKDFIGDKGLLDISDKKNELYLSLDNTLQKEQVYKGPRIGLSDKYPSFRNRDYRYVIMKHKIKKMRKMLK